MFFESITPNYLYSICILGKQIPAQTKKSLFEKHLWTLPQQCQWALLPATPAPHNKEGSQEYSENV